MLDADICCCDFSCALEQPRDKGPVEPVVLLALELALRLVREERFLLAVNLVFARVEIGLVRLDALCLLDDLVAEDEGEVDGDALCMLAVRSLQLSGARLTR